MILTTRDEQRHEDRVFQFSMKDPKDPWGTFQKLQQQIEDRLDPAQSYDIDSHPMRDWLRST